MPWAPSYSSLANLKAAVGISDTADDTLLEAARASASRAIDHHTGRQFGVLAIAAPRYYGVFASPLQLRRFIEIDDLMTTTDLVVKTDTAGDGTFATTLVLSTDYRLAPPNAAADGFSWTLVQLAPRVTVPSGLDYPDRAFEVTAKWGWTAVPAVVDQACLIQASRFFVRKNAPFGIAGSPELGSEMRLLAKLDPDVQALLAPVVRYWGWR